MSESVKQDDANVVAFTPAGGDSTDIRPRHEHLRMVEAIVFASAEPVSERALSERLPDDIMLEEL
ncbi:MAG: hypothetical protein COA99_09910, partial [Moraxellaceae bacterium]